MNIKFLPASKGQLSKVVALDLLGYEHPLDEDIIYECIKQNQLIMAWDGPKPVGYICYQSLDDMNLVLGLSTHPNYRRQGIGTALLRFVSDLGNTQIEVREKNLDGQLFLRSQNFTCFDVVKNKYDESDEDCYVFTSFATTLTR